VAVIVSFFFFAMVARTMPYKNGKTDRAAVLAEANLFVTILCILMIKINLVGELFTRSFYDGVVVGSNAIVAVFPMLFGVVTGLHTILSQFMDSSSDPPESGDVVEILEYAKKHTLRGCKAKVTDSSDDGHTLTVTLVRPCLKRWEKKHKNKKKKKKKMKQLEKDGKADSTSKHAGDFINSHSDSDSGSDSDDELQVDREQVRRVLSVKRALQCCGGLCKQAVACGRVLCCKKEEEEEEESEEEDPNVRAMLVEQLQAALEPILNKHGLKSIMAIPSFWTVI
jgi:hypothetical protein